MDSCSADPSSSHHQPSLAPDDVNEILRQKRKTRLQRACYPCRQRKVKCDNATPCQTCKDRQHSQLCTYEPPSKRIDDGSSHRSPSSHAPATRSPITHDKVLKKLEHLEHYIQEIKEEVRVLATVPRDQSSLGPSLPAVLSTDGTSTVRDIEDEDIYARSGVTGDAVYYGANSVLATITALRNSGNEAVRQNLAENNTLSLLGLGNRNATYPFVDLGVMAHGSLSRMQELCKLLPTNAEILQHFRQYRDNVHPLYPGIVALPEFEADLVSFLARRAAAPCDVGDCCLSERNVSGATLHWVALLFGVLSSSCQWSTMCARKQPDAASQVFVCCAYDCLRITNYLAYPTLVDLQTLLVLGDVLTNDMNAGVAWSFLGLTIRLAQSLGLHRPSPLSFPLVERNLRTEIWWRIVWQDSLLSTTFGRASSISAIGHHRDLQILSGQNNTYIDCMKSLCQVGLDLVRQRSDDETQHRRSAHTAQYQKALESITEAAADPLRNVQACKSITGQLEHWNFLLHRSYMTSEVYRPFLKRQDDTNLDFKDNRKKCIEALAETVNAYLGLENITQSAHQSWAAVHRALSSGLLLAIVKEHLRSERVQMLLERLIDVVSNLRSDTDTADISTPITRSISALSSLVDLDSERGLGKSKTQQRQWVPGQSQMPTVVHESLPTPTGSDNAKHSSPYKVRDQILWGS